MKQVPLLLLAGVLSITCTVSARTWRITPEGTGDAPTIQAGIDSAASGDTVLVACGIYYDCTHSTPDGQAACVIMESGVILRSETGLPDCATIDAQQLGRVLFCDQIDSSASIEGFTITGGTSQNGGGILCDAAAPTFTSLVITGNSATQTGGGLVIRGTSGPTLASCILSYNTTGGNGGAVCITGGSSAQVTFSECTLSDNWADWHGGGVYCTGARLHLEGCIVSANTCGGDGGGILLENSGTSIFLGCVFRENHSPSSGGAIDCIHDVFASVHNCTFYGNGYFSLSFWESAWGWLRNTIIANGQPGYAIYTMSYDEVPDLECCNIYGNAGGDWVSHIGQYYGINGNFSACPSFCHAEAGDFHLCDESSCLPGNHPDGYDCGLVGACGEGCSCGPSQSVPTTWGAIKSMYR